MRAPLPPVAAVVARGVLRHRRFSCGERHAHGAALSARLKCQWRLASPPPRGQHGLRRATTLVAGARVARAEPTGRCCPRLDLLAPARAPQRRATGPRPR